MCVFNELALVMTDLTKMEQRLIRLRHRYHLTVFDIADLYRTSPHAIQRKLEPAEAKYDHTFRRIKWPLPA
jgi:hypothetical protein